MKVIITESRLTNVIDEFLNTNYKDIYNCWMDWGNYSCGWGVCCDPYAIAFIPNDERDGDHYMFKLVDSKNYSPFGDDYPDEWMDELPDNCDTLPDINEPQYDKIVVSKKMADSLEFFGTINVWGESLLTIINSTFDLNANQIALDYYL